MQSGKSVLWNGGLWNVQSDRESCLTKAFEKEKNKEKDYVVEEEEGGGGRRRKRRAEGTLTSPKGLGEKVVFDFVHVPNSER